MLKKTSLAAAAMLLATGLLVGGAQAQSTTTPAPTGPKTTAPAATAAPATPAAPAASAAKKPAAAAKLDINTASATDLGALPGMTPAYAQAVITGRPYRRKTELVSKKILPQTVYSGFSDKIIAHRVKS